MIGVEPMKTKFAIPRFAVQPHRRVLPEGIEPSAFSLKDCCSNQLSYGSIKQISCTLGRT